MRTLYYTSSRAKLVALNQRCGQAKKLWHEWATLRPEGASAGRGHMRVKKMRNVVSAVPPTPLSAANLPSASEGAAEESDSDEADEDEKEQRWVEMLDFMEEPYRVVYLNLAGGPRVAELRRHHPTQPQHAQERRPSRHLSCIRRASKAAKGRQQAAARW